MVWYSGGVVGHINEVALHRARLMLGWVTIFGRQYISMFNQPPGQLSLASLRVAKLAGGKGGYDTSARWQVGLTLCDPTWQVSSRSSES